MFKFNMWATASVQNPELERLILASRKAFKKNPDKKLKLNYSVKGPILMGECGHCGYDYSMVVLEPRNVPEFGVYPCKCEPATFAMLASARCEVGVSMATNRAFRNISTGGFYVAGKQIDLCSECDAPFDLYMESYVCGNCCNEVREPEGELDFYKQLAIVVRHYGKRPLMAFNKRGITAPIAKKSVMDDFNFLFRADACLVFDYIVRRYKEVTDNIIDNYSYTSIEINKRAGSITFGSKDTPYVESGAKVTWFAKKGGNDDK